MKYSRLTFRSLGIPIATMLTMISTACRTLGIPFSATMKTRVPPYVTDSMSAEEKTAALQRAKKDAYQAAKETYKKNHVDKNSRPDVSVPSDRSMTRAEWDKAYQAARGQGKERYTQDFADLARYRHEQGMPRANPENRVKSTLHCTAVV